MEEKKKGGKRAAPNRRGWLLAVLVLAGLGIWGILEWRAHTAPGPGISVNEEALTRREPFYQYDAPGVTAYAGVDVSSYQGVVDWPAVKAAGADFAMLRVGFRGYGTGALVEDNAFAQNAADAANAGLTVGVYFYSQAVTEEEAAEEARFVVERLRVTNVSGPIAYDLEFYTADEARTDDLTGEQATQNAIAFCDVIRQAGYEPVVYMNLHWAGSMYGMEELAHLPVWLASYGPVPALDRGVTLWQYSESGVVDGIEGPVEHSYVYVVCPKTGLPSEDGGQNTTPVFSFHDRCERCVLLDYFKRECFYRHVGQSDTPSGAFGFVFELHRIFFQQVAGIHIQVFGGPVHCHVQMQGLG